MTRSATHRRLEVDREDLMREASALRQRAEFRVASEPETVIAGYRSDGALSIYFGPDPCYHFNSDLQLRRAFVDGDLYRTQGSTLAAMSRHRTDDQVQLRRHDLSTAELAAFMDQTRDNLTRFANALTEGNAMCIQSIPMESSLAPRLEKDLNTIIACNINLAPSIRGRD